MSFEENISSGISNTSGISNSASNNMTNAAFNSTSNSTINNIPALNTGVSEDSLRIVSSSPIGNEQVSDEELRPNALEGFIGQPLLKAQLQLFFGCSKVT